MKIELLEILRCPKTNQKLRLEVPEYLNGLVRSAWLVSEDGHQRYPVREFIPRFVPESNYADNFGMQWNKFRQTQLDSYSGHPISANRFWQATGWNVEDIAGKWVLDVGCGAGRFAEVALQAGAKVVALDYSRAVDACLTNLRHYPNLHVVQGDIYSLPFLKASFSFVYSLGVLQHTPDVARAFAALPGMVAEGGWLCTDFYWKRLRTLLHSKYLFRPITKHMPQQQLFHFLEKTVPALLKTSQLIGRIPLAGRYLKRLIPVADYTGVYPLDERQLREWALLDTFDMLGPQYDSPQSATTIRQWMSGAGFNQVEVFQANLLVVRGHKI
ncbi:methyltransferase domain-containing protein [Polynucleobacter sp. MWH-HuK1]|uniref:methyltransferase domain-containing protein n=1 Tax=Polynucleobacter sp. MWH-HuK1 TaxID=1743158 RepID=UPI001C0E37AD|nr:methyltransferase domain-containing protein [Polynucleobacter sp. MWH-HuK1]MBU3564461.1 methyltransferase domain-containing protein [Polynucleobacter sp. MWH-HuK1]